MGENSIKYELQNILQGKIQVSQGELIQTIANYLRESTQTGGKTQRNEPNKIEETKKLVEYINKNKLWNSISSLVS